MKVIFNLLFLLVSLIPLSSFSYESSVTIPVQDGSNYNQELEIELLAKGFYRAISKCLKRKPAGTLCFYDESISEDTVVDGRQRVAQKTTIKMGLVTNSQVFLTTIFTKEIIFNFNAKNHQNQESLELLREGYERCASQGFYLSVFDERVTKDNFQYTIGCIAGK